MTVLDQHGNPFFLLLTRHGPPSLLRTVVKDLGVHPNSANGIGHTMLAMESLRGNTKKLQTLVDLGANVNQADNNGMALFSRPRAPFEPHS